ncbi:DUF5947 family protein [Spirillospora sp. NBC_01491]|uniref:DUF5947 family protein n=1 Tax=Spirillospora sp. NBC_01491 TaxID=2976007 RepID=UPI002E355E58|nr:DUF5947 family protein [Spirillospora sp. NBC_01491]
MSLRRFATPPAPAPGTVPGAAAPPGEAAGEVCELCADPLGDRHGHLVDREDRRIMCACRPCSLLFAPDKGQRLRMIPERYRHDPGFALTEEDWIFPVRTAFFFRNSALGRMVALYPSPAGATESELPLDAWERIMAAGPAAAHLEPDVEALLVDRESGAYLVPIDACYRLVGLVRLHWKGFDGGTEARDRIDAFFAGLRERADE